MFMLYWTRTDLDVADDGLSMLSFLFKGVRAAAISPIVHEQAS